jgi:hypothetical protein
MKMAYTLDITNSSENKVRGSFKNKLQNVFISPEGGGYEYVEGKVIWDGCHYYQPPGVDSEMSCSVCYSHSSSDPHP